MMKNRVLRFFKRPEGAYHGSVFFQLSGGIGPSCLALDAQGSLYIGQFETRCKALLHVCCIRCCPRLACSSSSPFLSINCIRLSSHRRNRLRGVPPGQRGSYHTGGGARDIWTSGQVSACATTAVERIHKVESDSFRQSKSLYHLSLSHCTQR
jgi:hypothetical protein